MKPTSELVDPDKVFEVVVSAAYRVTAPSEGEAFSRAKEMVSRYAVRRSRVDVLSYEITDENRPPNLPSGMDRWREAFERLEVGRREGHGQLAVALDRGSYRWWSNGEILLLATYLPPGLEAYYRPELRERLSAPRQAVTFGPAFRGHRPGFPIYVRNDDSQRLSAAAVYLELVESSVPGVRWFCTIGEEMSDATWNVVDRIVMGVDDDDNVVAIVAPCRYAEPPK